MTGFEDKEMGRSSGHPSRRRLEQLAFTADERAIAEVDRAHLRICDECQSRVEQLRNERSAFLVAKPPEAFVAELVSRPVSVGPLRRLFERYSERPWNAWKLLPVAAAWLVAIGVAVFFFYPGGQPDEAPGMSGNQIAFKGSFEVRLDLFVSRGGEPAVPYDPTEQLMEGDVLRFGVRASSGGYLFIGSIDDQGKPTAYYPQRTDWDTRIEAGEFFMPEVSIVLDAFVGEELIVAIVSKTRLTKSDALGALERAYLKAKRTLDGIDKNDLPGDVAFKRIEKKKKNEP